MRLDNITKYDEISISKILVDILEINPKYTTPEAYELAIQCWKEGWHSAKDEPIYPDSEELFGVPVLVEFKIHIDLDIAYFNAKNKQYYRNHKNITKDIFLWRYLPNRISFERLR